MSRQARKDPTLASAEAEEAAAIRNSRPIDPALVREIASLLSGTDLTEIEVEKGDLRIRIARAPAQTVVHAMPAPMPPAAPVPVSVPFPAPAAGAPAPAKDPNALTSPMVGTAYLRPAPGAKPFVTVGSPVAVGEKVLLIEAMKTFNDIVATRAGTVRAIYVEDGQPVEYGEPLILID